MMKQGSDRRAPDAARVRVWDLPTRLFHWLLALAVLGAIVSAKVGGLAMLWHERCGYAVAALLMFRLVWGLFGGRWSRFGSFLYGPAALWRYLRGRPRAGDNFEVGHNPLGTLSVLALLGWIGLQVGSGLVADDGIATAGPFAPWFDESVTERWTHHHTGRGQVLLYVLLTLHVAAIVFYRRVKGRDLLRPMIDGDKLLPATVPASRDDARTRILALLLAAACAGLVVLCLRLAPG